MGSPMSFEFQPGAIVLSAKSIRVGLHFLEFKRGSR
jgi:hypothetical protein